ncbi:glycerophosphoryl diester phosphodiesterase membrane domain-containing protein [Streptomyces sp. XD-27]|uniref:glycerophosphoryl diester phosphodiesterase membrane domain-containing protein n=1 Tax=Streptomyces sp. XD-27 TaxID=3062779 RepID=UPI0026F45AEE|nr:glycerophosphoryl diester phosphodiesterase membrane domain-containing protein [Streptomyces sp. XD-27]WKX70681.1 glycerophosphoryl diester phosphodiesterase membrane domain-containing protein [Streptomyces sp. XD-27]
MNDSPGWAPPGPPPSEDPDRDTRGTGEGSDRPVVPEQPVWGAKWAERQPPAGRWSAPGGPPPPFPRPPGPVDRGAWGAGWTQPPPVARPGVIPLRPLGVGEILDGAVSTMRAHWRTALGISLAVAVVTQILVTTATGLWFRDVSGLDALDDTSDPTLRETLDAIGGSLASNSVALLLGMLGTVVATALLTVVTSRAVLGRPVTTAEAWHSARPQLARLCGLLFLLPLIVVGVAAAGVAPGVLLALAGAESGGAALALLGGLAAFGAAIWLWIRFSLAAPALMLEKASVTAALRRSAKLVRGAWWRVFGIQLLALLIVLVVEAIVEIPTSMVAMVIGGDSASDWLSGETATVGWTFLVVIGIGGVIGATVTLPITAGITALLYMDQRIRREALDLELARAAGVDGNSSADNPSAPAVDTAPGD